MRGLSGKVAIVTGSTEGLGYGIAERLGLEGVKVVVSSRTESKVKAAVEKMKQNKVEVTGLVCDISKDGDQKKLVETAMEKYGAVDKLVCNAAYIAHSYPITQLAETEFDKFMHTNVTSNLTLTQKVVPHMKARGGGSILMMSSVTGYGMHGIFGAYGITKTSLFGLTKHLAHELVPDNIRVNALAPGFVHTPGVEATVSKEMEEGMLAYIPMKRFGTVDEISGPAAFLLSEEASYMTGEIMIVGGGWHARI